MSNQVFMLNRALRDFSAPEKDAIHVSFEDAIKFSYYFRRPERYPGKVFPEQIYFRANLNSIQDNDYPVTDLMIPIISRKMMNIITNEMEDIDAIVIPVTMIDNNYVGELFDDNGLLNPHVPINDDYVAFNLITPIACLNFEKSEYTMSAKNSIPMMIRKVILAEPKGGFPTIFRMNVFSSNLFFTKEFKDKLESNNNIRGCAFKDFEYTSYQESEI